MLLTNVIIEIHLVLLFTLNNTKNIAYHITEVLIFYADKLIVKGTSKNSHVFNFVILLKSRKFDARDIYMFYSKRRHQVLRCFLMSASHVSICCFNFVAGSTMSIVNGWRLNGSNWSLQQSAHTAQAFSNKYYQLGHEKPNHWKFAVYMMMYKGDPYMKLFISTRMMFWVLSYSLHYSSTKNNHSSIICS